MNTAGYIIKRLLVVLLLGMLFLPHIQTNLKLFEVKDLDGSFKKAPEVDFKFDYWWEGILQENKEKYLAEQFGLRNTCVRLHNQLKFNLFKKSSNAEVVIGKDNWLFAHAYVESYTGKNFAGVDKIVARSIVIKKLQDKMQEKGKIFLPVLAPNKARVLPQLLPKDTRVQSFTNYEAYVMCFKKLGVRYIDFDDYFIKNYNSSKYPLYPKYGVHWSTYGHTLAADSIINYLNYYYRLNTPKMKWKESIFLSDSLREMDYDAGEGMNLLVNQMPSEKMAYSKNKFTDTANYKPSVFVVGDSYNFGIEYTKIYSHVFSNYTFLYYMRELYPTRADGAFLKLKLKDELDSHQVFLMIATEHNLVDYGWGFAEKALNVLEGRDDNFIDKYTRDKLDMETFIKKDKAWFAQLTQKALATERNVNDLVSESATYIMDKKYKRQSKGTPLQEMVKSIKADPKWLNQAAQKAMSRHIPLDSAIMQDARWQVEHNK